MFIYETYHCHQDSNSLLSPSSPQLDMAFNRCCNCSSEKPLLATHLDAINKPFQFYPLNCFNFGPSFLKHINVVPHSWSSITIFSFTSIQLILHRPLHQRNHCALTCQYFNFSAVNSSVKLIILQSREKISSSIRSPT